jgi:DNA replication and repair protein RecF
MDNAICQLRPRYASALSEFNRLYDHKVRILKDHFEKPSLLDTLDDFNYRLAQVGSELIYYRAFFARRINEYAGKIHRDFSGDREELTVEYKTVRTVDDPFKKPSEILPRLLEHQAEHRDDEIAAGQCLTGPQRDDLDIKINGISAKSFASQGQTRTAALSLKLAERELHFNDRGEYPVLLLDDVLSELDPIRQSFVLNKITEGQVFITCCEDGQIINKTGGKVIKIKNGEIV